MLKPYKQKELWVTNISTQKAVNITDLRLTLQPGQSINLLAKKINGTSKFKFSEKHIQNSISSGSIAKHKNILKLGKQSPLSVNRELIHESSKVNISEIPIDSTHSRNNRIYTPIEIPDFPDLDIAEDESVESFASDAADMEFLDRTPVMAVDPKFK